MSEQNKTQSRASRREKLFRLYDLTKEVESHFPKDDGWVEDSEEFSDFFDEMEKEMTRMISDGMIELHQCGIHMPEDLEERIVEAKNEG